MNSVQVGTVAAQEQTAGEFIIQVDREFYPSTGEEELGVGITVFISKDIFRDGELPVFEMIGPKGVLHDALPNLSKLTDEEGSHHLDYSLLLGSNSTIGNYTVIATYLDSYQAKATFIVEPAIKQECQTYSCTLRLQFNNVTYAIPYTMVGIVRNVTADLDRRAIVLDLSPVGSTLWIAIPKNLLNATENESNSDTRFTILINGVKWSSPSMVESQEALQAQAMHLDNAEQYRIVTVNVGEDTRRVEIIGAQIAPEFSSTVVGILISVVSISTVIGWSRTKRGSS